MSTLHFKMYLFLRYFVHLTLILESPLHSKMYLFLPIDVLISWTSCNALHSKMYLFLLFLTASVILSASIFTFQNVSISTSLYPRDIAFIIRFTFQNVSISTCLSSNLISESEKLYIPKCIYFYGTLADRRKGLDRALHSKMYLFLLIRTMTR